MTASKKKTGFALLPKERVQELGRQGGIKAHALGLSYEWDIEDAKKAAKQSAIARQLMAGQRELDESKQPLSE